MQNISTSKSATLFRDCPGQVANLWSPDFLNSFSHKQRLRPLQPKTFVSWAFLLEAIKPTETLLAASKYLYNIPSLITLSITISIFLFQHCEMSKLELLRIWFQYSFNLLQLRWLLTSEQPIIKSAMKFKAYQILQMERVNCIKLGSTVFFLSCPSLLDLSATIGPFPLDFYSYIGMYGKQKCH